MSDVEVSFQGIQQLVTHTRRQYLSLGEASGFMCRGGMNNTGAFTGILALFQGTYEDTVAAVTEGLDDAMTGAHGLSQAIAACRTRYRNSDDGIDTLLQRLEITEACGPSLPGTKDGPVVPEVSPYLVNANNWLDIDTPVPGGLEVPDVNPYPFDDLNASTGDPLDLVDQTIGLVNNADSMGDGSEDAGEMDDFIEEHDR